MTVAAEADKAGRKHPDVARLAAARILFAVTEEGAYANISAIRLLEQEKLAPRDRSFASALVYGTLSRLPAIDWYLNQAGSKPLDQLEGWARTALRLGVWQLYWSRSVPARAAVDQSVRIAADRANPGAAAYTNAVLRRLSAARPDLPAKLKALEYGLTTELFGYLKKWYGPVEAAALAEAGLLDHPTITVRVNALKTTPDALVRQLAADNYLAAPGRYVPEALQLSLAGRSIRALTAWQQGLLTVQDEAAMLTAILADPQPGQLVLDLCAAPGGKTTHLAERMLDQGRILAVDNHPERLKLVTQQAERLGLTCVETWCADAVGVFGDTGAIDSQVPAERSTGRSAADRQEPCLIGRADVVLADVPCSGLGLLGRKPEIRLTMNHERMQGLYPIQAAILDHAADLVRPGGHLVYSTCTINPAENHERIAAFLARHSAGSGLPAFEPADLTGLLPDTLLAFPDLAEQARGGSIQLLPNRHFVDGFFIARLRRRQEIRRLPEHA